MEDLSTTRQVGFRRYFWNLIFLAGFMFVLWPFQRFANSLFGNYSAEKSLGASGYTICGFMILIQTICVLQAISFSRRLVGGRSTHALWSTYVTVIAFAIGWMKSMSLLKPMAPYFVFRPLLAHMGLGQFLPLAALLAYGVWDEARREKKSSREAGIVAEIVGDGIEDAAGGAGSHGSGEAMAHVHDHFLP